MDFLRQHKLNSDRRKSKGHEFLPRRILTSTFTHRLSASSPPSSSAPACPAPTSADVAAAFESEVLEISLNPLGLPSSHADAGWSGGAGRRDVGYAGFPCLGAGRKALVACSSRPSSSTEPSDPALAFVADAAVAGGGQPLMVVNPKSIASAVEGPSDLTALAWPPSPASSVDSTCSFGSTLSSASWATDGTSSPSEVPESSSDFARGSAPAHPISLDEAHSPVSTMETGLGLGPKVPSCLQDGALKAQPNEREIAAEPTAVARSASDAYTGPRTQQPHYHPAALAEPTAMAFPRLRSLQRVNAMHADEEAEAEAALFDEMVDEANMIDSESMWDSDDDSDDDVHGNWGYTGVARTQTVPISVLVPARGAARAGRRLIAGRRPSLEAISEEDEEEEEDGNGGAPSGILGRPMTQAAR